MSEDRSTNGHKSWLDKLVQAFVHEPKNRQELLELLREAHSNEVLDIEALSIIEGALQVSDMQVRDIMVPRSQMTTIKATQSPREFLLAVIEAAHSRFPVIGESIDDVLGVLLAKDLLQYAAIIPDLGPGELSLRDILRPAVFVPESKRLNVLLREFRQNRNHMAIVIDEYGGIAGLITIEDVLEEIVGEIEDETDVEEGQLIRPVNDNSFIVEALTPIDEFNEFFGTALSDEEFDTIGGLVINAFGQLPTRNQSIRLDQFQFKVVHADERRLTRLRVTTGAADASN